MKKVLISVFNFCNIQFDQAAIDAATEINVSEENMATINAKLTAAKGFEQALATSIADLQTTKDTLEAVTGERDNATEKQAEQATKIEELQTEVTRLGALAGGEKTTVEKTQEDRDALKLGAHANPELGIYKALAQLG